MTVARLADERTCCGVVIAAAMFVSKSSGQACAQDTDPPDKAFTIGWIVVNGTGMGVDDGPTSFLEPRLDLAWLIVGCAAIGPYRAGTGVLTRNLPSN